MFISFRFASKTKNFWKRNKQQYGVLILLWLEVKNRSKKKQKKFFLRERTKRIQNGSHFASFRFEVKIFVGETGAP
jgi:hypothetical protein